FLHRPAHPSTQAAARYSHPCTQRHLRYVSEVFFYHCRLPGSKSQKLMPGKQERSLSGRQEGQKLSSDLLLWEYCKSFQANGYHLSFWRFWQSMSSGRRCRDKAKLPIVLLNDRTEPFKPVRAYTARKITGGTTPSSMK